MKEGNLLECARELTPIGFPNEPNFFSAFQCPSNSIL